MDFKHGQHLQQNREAVQHGDIRELLANLMPLPPAQRAGTRPSCQ